MSRKNKKPISKATVSFLAMGLSSTIAAIFTSILIKTVPEPMNLIYILIGIFLAAQFSYSLM